MGKIELDHTGTGGGITLSSDGTDLLLDGTAIGGGGGTALELYAENPSSPTAPSATGANAVAIGSNARAASTGAIGLGVNSWARSDTTFAVFGAAQPSSIAAISIGLGSVASGAAAAAFGRDSYALASGSVSLGKSRASGTDSFAAAIANNTSSYGATGANSVAIGRLVKSTTNTAASLGGYLNVSSAAYSTTLGGWGNQATLDYATVAGGYFNIASGVGSFAHGLRASAAQYGKKAYASGYFAATGDAQAGTFVLRSDTTDATPEAVTSNNSTPSTTNQVILPNNSAYAFHGTIVARQQASQGTACAAWKVEGLIRREGSAGTTVLVNSATTVLDNTPAWGMALSADTTNGGLKIEVTGAAATNIRWVATINTSECSY